MLEVGCEEIPSRFVPEMLADLKVKAEEELKKARLLFSSVKTFGTGRRLVLSVQGLPSRQPDLVEERKGPPKERAYDPSGKPTQTAIGFAKSIGIDVKELKFKLVGEKEYVFGVSKTVGLPTEKILSEVLPKIITSLYLPLAMKWGSEDFKFIRPIHWIAALFGKKTVKFNLAGINSSDSTFGHRYASKTNAVKIKGGANAELFKKELKGLGVIVDPDERRTRIEEEVRGASKKLGVKPYIDEPLLNEVTNIVESGCAAYGKFDQNFLALPKDVLITSMKKNQKYFPAFKPNGSLDNSFVVITDCPDRTSAQATVSGNERVLSARLSDAKFFFDEDKKTPLSSRIADLKTVSFHEKLGSMYDKAKRIEDLALFLAKELRLSDVSKDKIKRIAELSKADLLTKMVFEFPDLQGVMGREYAMISGEDNVIAEGIFEHYLPRFSGDVLPKSAEGMAVAIADKLDSIVGCFSVGLIPTGSADPFALRRQAQGIVEIIFNKMLTLSLDGAIDKAYKLYEPVFLEHLFKKGETGYKDYSGIKKAVLEFLSQRLRNILLSTGIRYDVADAALSEFTDVLFAYQKANLLMKYLNSDLLKGIVMTADRVARISKGAAREQVIESDLIDDEEKKLHQLYLKVNWEVGSAIDKGDLDRALNELEGLTKPVDVFFEKVLVMHKDERVKANRLALLRSIDLTYRTVADFPKIVL